MARLKRQRGAQRGRAAPSPPKPERTRERQPFDALALILATIAVVVRLPHLGWGLPELGEEALPMRKALDMWNWPDPVNLDPRTAGWPSLSFYAHLLLQHLHYWVGRVLGTFSDRNDYFVAAWLDLSQLAIVSRAFDVLLAGAVVWLGAHLARRLAGPRGALLAGGLLALSPLLIEHSQLIEPDMLVAFFAALAVVKIVDIQQRGRLSDYLWAGAWIGLGISSKYTPILLLPAVFVAHALRAPGRDGRAIEPWLAAALAAVAFAFTSPFVLLEGGVLARDLAIQTLHMTGGHFGQGAVSGFVFYPVQVLGPGLGWTGFVLATAGLAWTAWTKRGPWLALAACVAPYFLGLALLRTQFPRYMLPLLMPLAVGVAGLAAMVSERWPRHATWIAAALGVIALGPAADGAWRYHAEIGRPTTQSLANRYLRGLAPRENPHVLAEVLSVSLPTPRTTGSVSPVLLNALTTDQRRRVAARTLYDIDFMPMYSVQPWMSAPYYDLRHAVAHDYVVTSASIHDRYRADSLRYATQMGFYRDLDHYGTLVRSFGAADGARGPEVRFYRIAPESGAALMRARGELRLDSTTVRPDSLIVPDWVSFTEAVGRAARARGDRAMAERYYAAAYDAATRAGMSGSRVAAIERVLEELRAPAR
jgi:dolichyl-phosphate-mannose-protein mannosyltransferase